MVRPIVAALDGWQSWLHAHFVCFRQTTLKTHLQNFAAHCASRAGGSKISWEERPVCIGAAIGGLGWVLPHVAIIDSFGLADWVIARTPTPPRTGRGAALVALFDRLDTDGDGTLDLSEQRAAAEGPLRVPDLPRDALVGELQARLCFDRSGEIKRTVVVGLANGLDNRYMAHEHAAPPGYLEGFRANVTCIDSVFRVARRMQPLTDRDIIAHEAEYRVRCGPDLRGVAR
jgi:hypothetical protein